MFKKIKKIFKKDTELKKALNKENQKKKSNIFAPETYSERIFSKAKKIRCSLSNLFSNANVDYEEIRESIEEWFIELDFGFSVAEKISSSIKDDLQIKKISDINQIKEVIEKNLVDFYGSQQENLIFHEGETNIYLVCGSNGVGKTTTIAKIANYFLNKNKKILLVAGDTFRAGAVEQLKFWANKLNIDISLPEKDKEDPAALIYKSLEINKIKKYDLIICDTSGRQHNNQNLMNQMEKIYLVIKKFNETAPHENILVLDSTLGQTSFLQSDSFLNASKISSIFLTKMDSTSRGGIIFAIKHKYKLPVKLIGVGESLDDIYEFDIKKIANKFVEQFEIEKN